MDTIQPLDEDRIQKRIIALESELRRLTERLSSSEATIDLMQKQISDLEDTVETASTSEPDLSSDILDVAPGSPLRLFKRAYHRRTLAHLRHFDMLSSFELISLLGTQATIRIGYIALHGLVTPAPAIAEDTYTLAGDPCWLYVSRARTGGTPTIEVQEGGAIPTTTATTFKKALYRFTAAEGGRYVLAHDHRHDIDLDAPTR